VQNIRGSDVVFRVGGEEFTIVMPGASLQVARARAEEICAAVAQCEIEHNGKHVGPITISLGVSVFPDDGSDAESLLGGADQALYQAKRTGRNRTATMSDVSA
jgi:diguanylate cyclase (GGDEF)-like protein